MEKTHPAYWQQFSDTKMSAVTANGCIKLKWVLKKLKNMCPTYKPFGANNKAPQFQMFGSHYSMSSGYML